MLHLKQPAELDRSWILSSPHDEVPDTIPKEIAKLMRSNHVMPIEFLYNSYKKGLNGCILNEEEDMNVPLQISIFLRAVSKEPLAILVICPDHLVCPWHYHLSQQGNFKVQNITDSGFQEKLNTSDERSALLLGFSNLNYAESLVEENFFAIIVDNFDAIASKIIFRKLSGKFNVGSTHRNFYRDPDPKLQWKMLNWTNPGCCGKRTDFPEIHSSNVTNLRDNYRFWWLRLTWNFCESFQRPSDSEVEEYDQLLQEWSQTHKLDCHIPQHSRPKRKRAPSKAQKFSKVMKKESTEREGDSGNKNDTSKNKKTTRTEIKSEDNMEIDSELQDYFPCEEKKVSGNKNGALVNKISEENVHLAGCSKFLKIESSERVPSTISEENMESDSSSDTIILEDYNTWTEKKSINFPGIGENPILTSTIKNAHDSPSEPATSTSSHKSSDQSSSLQSSVLKDFAKKTSHNVSASSTNKETETSRIDGTFISRCSRKSAESDNIFIDCIKKENAKNGQNLFKNKSDSFLASLVTDTRPIDENQNIGTTEDVDVMQILQETDDLLRNIL